MWSAVRSMRLVAAFSMLAQPAAAGATSAYWADFRSHARQVPISAGRTLHLLCEGGRSPTVILESGVGDGMTVWRKVQPALAQHYRVCAYDRAGLGLSPQGPLPRDLVALTSDLERLLTHAGLRPPYVLVGHSLGSFVMRLYARRHPAAVVGLVLVDPPKERELKRAAKVIPGMERAVDREVQRSRECASAKDLTGDCEPDVPSDAPASVAKRILSLARQHYLVQAAELESGFTGPDEDEIERAGTDLGEMPLIVLTSEQFKEARDIPTDKRAAAQQLWMDLHNEIASLSKRGVNRVVPNTGHYIQLERPDAVISAVEELISKRHR